MTKAQPPARAYLLDNRDPEANARFAAISDLFDAWTLRHIDALGIGEGSRCWEVGAGGPSLVTALAERVGTSGYVLATDIDPRWLAGIERANVSVVRHDVITDPPPEGGFDLVHARLVLVHLSARARALGSMVDALKPGGWLLVEDADPALQPLACPDEHGPEERLANALRVGFRRLMAERGVELDYGRRLPRLLGEAGLSDVRAEGFFPLGSPACAALELATIEQIRERLITAGLATPDDIARHSTNVASGRLALTTAPLISAWGKKRDARSG